MDRQPDPATRGRSTVEFRRPPDLPTDTLSARVDYDDWLRFPLDTKPEVVLRFAEAVRDGVLNSREAQALIDEMHLARGTVHDRCESAMAVMCALSFVLIGIGLALSYVGVERVPEGIYLAVLGGWCMLAVSAILGK